MKIRNGEELEIEEQVWGKKIEISVPSRTHSQKSGKYK